MSTHSTLATQDPATLLNRIHQAFPDLTWQKYAYIDAGWDHGVIQLDDTYIFRFPKSPEYLSMLRDEIGLLAHLRNNIEARIPSYVYIAPDFSFGGYKMLPGRELALEYFSNLSKAQQDKAANNIADFLSSLHAVRLADLDVFHVNTEPNFAGYAGIAIEAEKYLRPNLPNEEYKIISKMLDDIALIQKYRQPACLIHADIAPKHLIWNDNDETMGFIDFSDRVISDPAYDFAELYTYGEPFVDAVYARYYGPNKDDQFLIRAKAYMKAIGIHSLAKNVYQANKMSHDEVTQLLKIGAELEV